MADLFISYAREDRECAELLARALSSRGWTVWWDRQIEVGSRFSAVIEHELAQARCIVVLWSRQSVTSDWVQSEAAEAAHRKRLVPVRIEDVRPPLEFRRLHTADLLHWRQGFDGPDFEACLASIERMIRKVTRNEPLATDFTISQDGKTFRAPDLATLRAWAAEGRLRADSQVYDPAPERWMPAREIPGLRDAWSRKPDPSTDDLVISQDGRKFSAPDLGTLRLWAAEGRVRADSQVYDPALRRWLPAREMAALQGVWQTPVTPHEPKRPTRYQPLLIAFGVLAILAIIGVSLAVDGWPGSDDPDDPPFTDTAFAENVATRMRPVMKPDVAPAPVQQKVANAPAAVGAVSVSVENRCTDRNIAVAICFLDTSGRWISTGWHHVGPQQTKSDIVQAVGPLIYFYGMSGATYWYGEPTDPLTRTLPVDRMSGFGAPVEEMMGATVTAVPFFGKQMPAGVPGYTQPFYCN